MRAEHIKTWFRGVEMEEDLDTPTTKGAGDNWRLFVKLVQAVWRKGKIPKQLLWIVVILLPKGGGD